MQIHRGETSLHRGDGIDLFVRSWRPEGEPRALVVVAHGFKSHSGRYDWVAEKMVDAGLAVYAADMRGQGRSTGERYWVDDVDDYENDLAAVVTWAKEQAPGVPTFVLGHSAGGLVSALFALDHQAEIDGFVCESFAFEVPPPEFALTVLKGLAHIAPRAPVLSLPSWQFSRDPAVVAQMDADPDIIHTAGPVQTLAALLKGHDRLGAAFGSVRLPILILHGTADKATRPHGSQRFYDEAGSADKTLKLYEGHFHDLLSDVGKEQVMDDVLEWIGKRLPAAR